MSNISPTRVSGQLRAIFEQAQEELAVHAAKHPEPDRKVIIVLLTTCVILTLQNYVFRNGSFEQVPALLEWFGGRDLAAWIYVRTYEIQDRQLAQLLFWAAGSVMTYVIIPASVIRLLLHERIADYGLNFRGILRSSWVYLAMFLFVIGPLAPASQTQAFQAVFITCSPASRSGRGYGSGRWPTLVSSSPWSFFSAVSWFTGCGRASAFTRFSR